MQLQHRFVDALPGDPDRSNVSRQVHHAAYTEVAPTPVADPQLLAWSDDVAELLGIPDADAEVPLLAGNHLPEGARPYAACYGGHQFGRWAGQLGDGRAIVLGEVEGPAGRYEVQLKGAGPTPYSRTADGRAVLRSSVREFLCSEAMHHLGIPTTRALSLVTTGEGVVRDMFYDGRPRTEPGAIVARVAESFLRFGSFEIHATRRDEGLLRQLVHHTIATHYRDIPVAASADDLGSDSILAWLHALGRRSAELVARWQGVGFTHGVLNTDNLSAVGLTIDYGPYGWLEGYDPRYTPNTSDLPGRRYAYGQQPHVVGWNLARLCDAMYVLVGEVEPLQEALDAYGEGLQGVLRAEVRRKLGLSSEQPGDDALLDEVPRLLARPVTDWTRFHRLLARVDAPVVDADAAWVAPLLPAFYGEPSSLDLAAWASWLRRWHRRSLADHGSAAARQQAMDAVNPRVVLRNWLVQQAIEAAEAGDAQPVRDLLAAVRTPFANVEGDDPYDRLEPAWARGRAGCSLLSCSS